MTKEKQVTISVKQHEALKKSVKDLHSVRKDHENMKQAYRIAETEQADMQRKIVKLEEDLENAKSATAGNNTTAQANAAAIAKKDEEIGQLKKLLATAQDALKKAGISDESMLNEGLLVHVDQCTKNYLWRKWKFVEDTQDLMDATKELIQFLPIDTNLPEEEFVRLYSKKVNAALAYMRNYVQSECRKRAYGKQLLVQCAQNMLVVAQYSVPLFAC